MPDGVGAELAQQEHRERGRADAVGVVVAVDADPLPAVDRGPDRRDRLAHVAERERVVPGQRALEKRPRSGRIGVPAPHEHRGERRRDSELVLEPPQLARRARGDRPGPLLHRTVEGTETDRTAGYSLGRFDSEDG